MEVNGQQQHIVMFPWLAMGHLLPFYNLSTLLSQKGHVITFISTPKNLLKLPKTPSHFNITFIPLPLPSVPRLPPHAESSADIPYNMQQSLKAAFDLLKSPLTDFLKSTPSIDWIIYDYASHWLPAVALELGISRAFFSLFNASCLAFIGPPNVLVNGADLRLTSEDFTRVPEWITFESNVAYRLYEISKYVNREDEDVITEPSDSVRFGISIKESDVVFVRSSDELEFEYFQLLRKMYEKPVIATGFFPPLDGGDRDDKWDLIKDWLDKQAVSSVVYVAFGTEASLSCEEVSEMAIGLEKSNLPFFWVMKESITEGIHLLPEGFEERVQGRGMVHKGWVPQVKVLSHESIGGFLTHCGWNSVVEGLGVGKVLILFPSMNEQGLNARMLVWRQLGVEIPRTEKDGSFTSDSVAETLRLAMVDDSGELVRVRAKEIIGLIGDRDKNALHVDNVARYLQENRSRDLIMKLRKIGAESS
ncbi:hypothetical protein ACFE04_013326 [Oxalis oulophora]